MLKRSMAKMYKVRPTGRGEKKCLEQRSKNCGINSQPHGGFRNLEFPIFQPILLQMCDPADPDH